MSQIDPPASGSRWEPVGGVEPVVAPAWAVPVAGGAGGRGGRGGRGGSRRVLTGAGLVLAGAVVGGAVGLGAGHALAGDDGLPSVPGVTAPGRGHDLDRDGGPGDGAPDIRFGDGSGSDALQYGRPPVTGGGA